MKKRMIAIMLALCTVFAWVPSVALPAVAAEAATVTFTDAGGQVISTQTVGETMDFTVPALPEKGLGWYYMAPDGSMRDAASYLGEASADMTFTLVSAESSLDKNNNWPSYTAGSRPSGSDPVNGALHAFCGGWSGGSYYRTTGMYAAFEVVNSYTILCINDVWGDSGIYLNNDAAYMVLGTGSPLAISYTAVCGGRVHVDFSQCKYLAGATAGASLILAVNGEAVWPTEAVGRRITKANVNAYGVAMEAFAGADVTLDAGDRLDIVLSNNGAAEVEVVPTLVYKTFTTTVAQAPTLGSDKIVYGSGEYITAANATNNWSFGNYERNGSFGSQATSYSDAGGFGNWWHCKGWLSGSYAGKFTRMQSSAGCGVGFAYTVTRTGTVDLASTFHIEADGVSASWFNGVIFRIVKWDGTAEKVLLDDTTYTAVGDYQQMLEDVPVKAGDRLFFVFRGVKGIASNAYHHYLASAFSGCVTYVGDMAEASSLVTGGENWPTSGGVFGGGWGFGDFADGAFNIRAYSAQYNCYGNWWHQQLFLTGGNLIRCAAGAAYQGAGFSYAVPKAGVVDLQASFTAGNHANYNGTYFSIVKTAAGSKKTEIVLAENTTAYSGRDVKAGVAAVSVEAGDCLYFLFRPGENYDHKNESAYLAKAFSASVTYLRADGLTIAETSATSMLSHAPATPADDYTADGVMQPAMTDNWSLVAYAASAVGDVTAADTDFYAVGYKETKLWEDAFWTSTADPDWGKSPTVIRMCGGHAEWGNAMGVTVNSGAGGFRYTADKAGFADIKIDSLLTYAEVDMEVAIFVDGQKIWPVGEAWFTVPTGKAQKASAAMATHPDALTDVFVGRGCAIDFLVRHTAANATAGGWAGRGTTFCPTVTFTSYAPVYADTAVTIGDVYQVVANAQAPVATAIPADQALPAVAAKNLVDEISFKIVGTVDGKEVTLYRGITSTAARLAAYITDDPDDKVSNVAKAALQYAGLAQIYFGYKAETPVNAGLPTVAPVGTYNDTVQGILYDGTVNVNLAGMALLLGDTISFKLTMESELDATDYLVQVGENADFSGKVDEYTIELREGKGYKAIIGSLKPTSWNQYYYFRVVSREGETVTPVSHTLRYSVATYCKNMNSDPASEALTNAILALYDAVSAYHG